jgi:hypothetical protein
LCDTELDVREDEGLVQVDGTLVVLGGLAELGLDEVQLGAVVEDVGVLLVLGEGGREVSLGGLRVGCWRSVSTCNEVGIWWGVGGLTELQVHAGALDEALCQGRIQLDALVHVLQGVLVVALEVAEGAAHVVGKGLVLAQVAQLQGAVEGGGGLGVALAGLGGHGLETLAQLALARLLVELGVVSEPGGGVLGAEALQVVGDEGGAGQLLLLALQDGLALLLGDLLQQALDALGAALVAEAVDDAAGRVVEQGLAVAVDLLVGVGAAVEGLDVLVVEVDGGGGVVDDLLPVAHGVVAGGAVGVEDGVLLAQDGLAVQVDGAVVVLGPVRLVARRLELGRVLLALLLGQRAHAALVDLGQLVVGAPAHRRLLGLGRGLVLALALARVGRPLPLAPALALLPALVCCCAGGRCVRVA